MIKTGKPHRLVLLSLARQGLDSGTASAQTRGSPASFACGMVYRSDPEGRMSVTVLTAPRRSSLLSVATRDEARILSAGVGSLRWRGARHAAGPVGLLPSRRSRSEGEPPCGLPCPGGQRCPDLGSEHVQLLMTGQFGQGLAHHGAGTVRLAVPPGQPGLEEYAESDAPSTGPGTEPSLPRPNVLA